MIIGREIFKSYSNPKQLPSSKQLQSEVPLQHTDSAKVSMCCTATKKNPRKSVLNRTKADTINLRCDSCSVTDILDALFKRYSVSSYIDPEVHDSSRYISFCFEGISLKKLMEYVGWGKPYVLTYHEKDNSILGKMRKKRKRKSIPVSFKFNKVPFRDVLKYLSDEYNFYYAGYSNVINRAYPVTAEAKNVSPRKAVHMVCKNQPFSCKFLAEDRFIGIYK